MKWTATRPGLPGGQAQALAAVTLARRLQRLARTAALLALGLVGAAGCAVEDDVGEPGPFGLTLHALTDSCGGVSGANPLAEVQSYTFVVRNEAGKTVLNKTASKSGATLTISEVPAGSGQELSLVGLVNGKPKWFGRRSGQKIVKNTTTVFDMTMMAVEAFTCIAPESGAAVNVLFPAVTPIGKGQVLITGGFGVATNNGAKLELTSAQDTAWIFDVDTGVLRELKDKARMKSARAGHNAMFLPKSNRVLIVGGAQKMVVDTAVPGPPSWTPTNGVNLPYEIFDVETETFVAPTSTEFAIKRVFPNLMALSDDYVVALGGAAWPASSVTDPTTYMNSNLYDPNIGDYGAFVKVGSALPLNTVRAGAAIATLGSTPDGGTKVLVWGGDNGSQRAEVFIESTDAGNGIFDGSYVVSGDITSFPGGLTFSSLTPIGKGKVEGKEMIQFLSVGGIRHDAGKWQPPNKDDVYIVSVDEDARKILTQRVPGLDVGVYLHQANRTNADHVVISGGFSEFGAPASFTLRTFDVSTRTFTNPEGGTSFVKRGGHSALTLANECLLMFGGVSAFDDLLKSQPAASDIYCPNHLLP